ncbi:hypothetical protein B0T26DRAFT_734621 [Lasiosphaeria miniovina]|uniref:Uncharacterized protein n=1 Tax=Lasiosphaeria miniovina TaxID=1954250 RepID=A0AA39ZQF4_9PEZI|nr:uncharacterized protein B0T26DRAFT_734621 [Lasiosphaeria miniovina]KAK0701789.1 hypothetical protein B0T26DRAFT_734621 [Lasiosphaeria miniovina]
MKLKENVAHRQATGYGRIQCGGQSITLSSESRIGRLRCSPPRPQRLACSGNTPRGGTCPPARRSNRAMISAACRRPKPLTR